MGVGWSYGDGRDFETKLVSGGNQVDFETKWWSGRNGTDYETKCVQEDGNEVDYETNLVRVSARVQMR